MEDDYRIDDNSDDKDASNNPPSDKLNEAKE